MNNNQNSQLKIVFNVVVLIALGVLFVLYFDKSNGNNMNTSNEVNNEVNLESNSTATESVQMPTDFKIAYINTDSLMTQYLFYKDANNKIENYEAQLKQMYETKANKLKSDYDNYVTQGKAGMLTLQQQKDTEAMLNKQQEELMGMEQSLSQESAYKRQELSSQVTDTILSFVNRYRIENGYTLVLQYGSMSGLLSASPSLDVTKEVIERLNAKYEFDKNH